MDENAKTSDKIGYKNADDGYIIKLKITGQHNEDRKTIVDPLKATYLCTEAVVLDIYRMGEKEKITKITCKFGSYNYIPRHITYTIGETITPNEYENSYHNQKVGISYFIDENMAYQEHIPIDADGLHERYDWDGWIWLRYTIKNKKYDGLYESWHNSKQLSTKYMYADGKKNGQHQSWDEYGRLEKECTYKDDELDGCYLSFYGYGIHKKCYYTNGILNGPYHSNNDGLSTKCSYKNGKIDGPYISIYRNGQLARKCLYVDDILDGFYESYYATGQLYNKCTYKMGKLDGPSKQLNGNSYDKHVYKDGELVVL